MINHTTKDKIQYLHQQYAELVKGNTFILKEITLAEIPDHFYSRNHFINLTMENLPSFQGTSIIHVN